jgi:hypothetical protein
MAQRAFASALIVNSGASSGSRQEGHEAFLFPRIAMPHRYDAPFVCVLSPYHDRESVVEQADGHCASLAVIPADVIETHGRSGE